MLVRRGHACGRHVESAFLSSWACCSGCSAGAGTGQAFRHAALSSHSNPRVKISSLQERTLDSVVAKAMQDGADVILTSGGVSMGDTDLVKPMLERLGTVHFGRVLMKPGKPVTFATIKPPQGDRNVLFFGLPGTSPSHCACLLPRPRAPSFGATPHSPCLPPWVGQVRWQRGRCGWRVLECMLASQCGFIPHRLLRVLAVSGRCGQALCQALLRVQATQ